MEFVIWIVLILVDLGWMAWVIKQKKAQWIPTLVIFLLAILSIGYAQILATGDGWQDLIWTLYGAFFVVLGVMSIGITAVIIRKSNRNTHG